MNKINQLLPGYHFAEYLLLRYKGEVKEDYLNKIELSEEQKEELTERYNNWKKNPEQAIPWEDAKSRLNSRYGL